MILETSSLITCDVLPLPKTDFEYLEFGVCLLTALTIFLLSTPVRTFHWPLMVSTHSVFFLMVIQGTFSKYASFCIPPESVMTFAEFCNRAIKSIYPIGSNVLTLEHFKSLFKRPKPSNIFFVLGCIGNTMILSLSASSDSKSWMKKCLELVFSALCIVRSK